MLINIKWLVPRESVNFVFRESRLQLGVTVHEFMLITPFADHLGEKDIHFREV